MISDSKLEEFFLDDKTPNWERYFECYFFKRFRKIESKELLRDIDFYLCKRGFLTIRGGYDLVDSYGSFLTDFNKINRQQLRVVREIDAEKVGEIVEPGGYYIKPALDRF